MKQPHDITQCLRDIRTCIDTIEEYLTETMGNRRDFNVYMRNRMLRQAVERNIEIIGEATGRILRTDPSFELENARRIIGTRNWVIHTYEKIDDAMIWGIVTYHLPPLREEVERLLAATE